MKQLISTLFLLVLTTTTEARDKVGTYSIIGGDQANPHAVANLRALLDTTTFDGDITVYIGERGDRSVARYKRRIPSQPDGFYINVGKGTIVVAGNNERGTLYGVDELARHIDHINDNMLTEHADYPAISFRGVVEGFYGTPWSHEARMSQLDFYRTCRLNTYIYGPKDDPYHSSPHWREPYPEREAAQIGELVSRARSNGVDFVWAIHPGKDIKWTESDLDSLIGKFESMYDLGVRSFAVFFDDISGDGTNPVRQAELLNNIDKRFVRVKGDVSQLIMCPTEYNRSWVNPEKGYLTTIGRLLNPSVKIMWTGDRVVSDITAEGLEWIKGQTGRPAYIWWNFPVSDYVRDHMLMGRVYGLTQESADMMSGFVTNPMEHAEASKIAAYGVGKYCWNPALFDSHAAWDEALRALMPCEHEALRIFAMHNSDMGQTGHKYRREESTNIAEVAERCLEKYRKNEDCTAELSAMKEEFERMESAADILLGSNDNETLVKELTPWLLQFRVLARQGQAVIKLATLSRGDNTEACADDIELTRKHIEALRQMTKTIDEQYNQNPYQPGVKCGTKVLQPFVNGLLEAM
ncbi:MAG: beta-N-acetylglucosaminidase domain-containing protein [Rikenellaceae bacterium]|nr:beta-N-acetylglucosaminidase domain-containing protein [Rikenellaceae bacterium]MDE7355529.1 beta-N-acetylglucosaminidase domain-containing protein [Rikenellaceae bacterium]